MVHLAVSLQDSIERPGAGDEGRGIHCDIVVGGERDAEGGGREES